MASNPDENTNKRKHDYEQRCEGGRRSASGGSSTEVYGRGYPREDTPPAQCSVLCGPRSCSTLPSSLGHQNDCGTSPPEPKRRRMWGLRGLVKMFRRKVRRKAGPDSAESPQAPPPAMRARSASELTVDPANRNSGTGPYNQGLSVSHDSVFSPESPTEHTRTPPSGLALATRGVNMSELKAALRRRRGVDSVSVEDDFDDPGLPRSPPTSPTTLDVLNHGLKSSSRGAQSSCSDGSLLSMGSSENDEDSFGVVSHHSSKHSLFEARHQVVDNEPAVGAAPLSHKAARHKISVRPKRTHGIPRARKEAQTIPSSLPTTPEVNEDSRNETLNHLSSSFTPPLFTTQEAERPSSVILPPTEFKSRPDRGVNRRAERKSLPNPPSQSVERKEEPFLSSLFGSARSGQIKEGNNDTSRDSTGARLSREKRKDQVRTPTGSKSGRQKSDPTRLIFYEEIYNERTTSSQRSSSVEGRLEGNPLQGQFRMDEPIPVPPEFEMETGYSEEVPFDPSSSAPVNRLSSSFDNLNEDLLPSTLTSQNQIGYSMESCEGQSSTDSLTVTPLPGIYIRSNQSLTRPRRSSGLQQARESISRFKEEHQLNVEATGPLSLDSSLNLVQHVGEEFRKALSNDEATFGKNSLESNTNSAITVPRPSSIMRSVSVNSPSSSRGSSVRSRKSSIGDELESDSSLSKVSLRRVKREPSIKKPAEEPPSETVPEFLRIQLNRVQGKASSNVVTPDPKTLNNVSKTSIVNVREWSEASRIDRYVAANEEMEKPKEQSEIIIGGKKLVEVNLTNKVAEKSSPNQSDIQSHIIYRGSSKKANEESIRKEEKDEIILRRPSVVDRAIVIDQSMGTHPSSPTTKGNGDEPELFKVFARRSFKLKDPEMEPSYAEKMNEGDKENHLPGFSQEFGQSTGKPQRKLERHSVIPSMAPGTGARTSLPVLKNISSKRYSFDSTAVGIPLSSEVKSVLLNNNISVEEPNVSLALSKGVEATHFKGKPLIPPHETALPISQALPLHKKSQIQTYDETNMGMENLSEIETPTEDILNQHQRSNIISKPTLQNFTDKQSTSLKYMEKESRILDSDLSSSTGFDSAIIRRSLTSNINSVSEITSTDSESSEIHQPKFTKTQAIIWPPRSQTSYVTESTGNTTSATSRSSHSSSTSSSSSAPPGCMIVQGRSPLPNSKILNSFREQHSPLSDESEYQPGKDDVVLRISGPIEIRKRSLTETNSSILAEARNTTFAHSLDNHSSPLALSYLGRGADNPALNLSRKGSMDETRSNAGAAEDWRLLVKQRREDRMKQTRTPDAEEIIIETRPAVSRNSKVLEMANNFQKLQVA